MNKNKFLYVAALFGMMVLVSCSSHGSAKNVTVTSEQSGAESQAASDIVSKPLTLLQSNDGWSYGAAGAKGFYFVSAAARSGRFHLADVLRLRHHAADFTMLPTELCAQYSRL